MTSRLYLAVAALLSFSHASVAHGQTFETIAHWRFESGADFLKDSSGNGNDLQPYPASGFVAPNESTEKPASAVGLGSAEFNGSNTFAQTIAPLVLSNYDWVRWTYWLKVQTMQPDQVAFENSFDSNFQVNEGSTMHIVNPSGVPDNSLLIAHRTGPGLPSQATTLDHAFYEALDEWHFVQVDYNFTEPVPDERVRVWVDGVEGSTFRSISGAHEWAHLRDDMLYVGGRRDFTQNPSLLFTGKIDEVKIEGLQVASGLAGDFNDDGSVDAADYVVWRKYDGTSSLLPNDDGLGDPVGSAHYELWRTKFGETASGAGGELSTNTAVPEPTSLLLNGLLAVILAANLRVSAESRPNRRE